MFVNKLDKFLLGAFFVGLWVCLAIGNAGFLHASFMNGSYQYLPYDKREVRQDLTICIGFSMLPPMWVITPFVTGFYQDGWTLTLKPKER